MVKRTRSNRGIVSRLYGPLHRLFNFSGKTVGVATNTARNVVKRGIKAVNNVGLAAASGVNAAGRNLVGKTRKNRRGGRKNRTARR